ATAFSHVTIDADTRVAMDGASITNVSGNVVIESRASLRNSTDAGIFQTGFFGAAMGVDARSITTSATDVDIAGSSILAKRVEINAGRANAIDNSLTSISEANGSLISAFVGLGVALTRNEVNLDALITVSDSSSISSGGNLILNSGTGLLNTAHDGLVLVLAVIPYGYSVSNQAPDPSLNADVIIDTSARLRAGVNYQTLYQIAYAPNYLGAGNSLTDAQGHQVTSRSLTTAEKTALGLDAAQDYTIGYWDSTNLAVDMFNGDIVQLQSTTNGATGTVGNYYQFVGNPTASAMSVILSKADYTDRNLWVPLGSTLTDQQAPSAFGSDDVSFIANALARQVLVIRPVGMDDIGISVGDLGTVLLAQYQTVRGWMQDHSTNAEALVRYNAELEQIEQQLSQLGLSVPTDGNASTLDQTVQALFVTVPDIVASPGSIYITSGVHGASDYASLTSGSGPVMLAHADVQVTVKSDLYMMMRLGDVVIDSARVARISAATGDYQEFSAGNIYVNDQAIPPVVSATDAGAVLTVSVNVRERSSYDYL
ncbi:MAG: hypothetical protein EBU97_04735, partial [Rhodobacteraceae bacterium]|nr:hypothetical protein [Paracoccaceae bacterium]